MEIILKEDVIGLGYKNDIVNVKPGYGRNYLIPQGKGVIASAGAKKALAEELKQKAVKLAKIKADAEALAEKLNAVSLTINAKVSNTGVIYGSVNSLQIADELQKLGFNIDRKIIVVKDVKAVGEYVATVKLHKEVAAQVPFTVVAENARGKASQKFTLKVGDRMIALTPPMGWNSWNCWALSVSQEKVMSSAQALLDKGLADYGYCYMNIDDGWEAEKRNADGTIAVNDKFPSMKALGDWLHERGLKFGIYSSPGDYTCGAYLGSIDHELQDAESYNSWGHRLPEV